MERAAAIVSRDPLIPNHLISPVGQPASLVNLSAATEWAYRFTSQSSRPPSSCRTETVMPSTSTNPKPGKLRKNGGAKKPTPPPKPKAQVHRAPCRKVVEHGCGFIKISFAYGAPPTLSYRALASAGVCGCLGCCFVSGGPVKPGNPLIADFDSMKAAMLWLRICWRAPSRRRSDLPDR